MAMKLKLIFMLIPIFAIFGCNDKGDPSVAEVEKLIQQNLKPGDPDAKVVDLLNRSGFPYNFNEFELRYESYMPKSQTTDFNGMESVIGIDIYVNKDRSFKRAEVRKVFTYL